MKRLVFLLVFSAAPLLAQSVISTSRGVVVSLPGSVRLIDGHQTNWQTEGLELTGKMVTDGDRLALLDPVHDRLRLIDLRTGAGRTFQTAETPIDGAFAGGSFYLLCRDSRLIQRFDSSAPGDSLKVEADSVFLRVVNRRILVYSRLTGTLSEISLEPLEVKKSVRVAPFASDLRIDERNAYLVYPRRSKVSVVSLQAMSATSELEVGAVPVSLAFATGSSALSAKTLAVADPASKRVWLVEGAQSTMEAFTRGMVRGLIGLGLYANRDSRFPTGVDRVLTRGPVWVAYDSSSRTLYRFTKNDSRILARDVGPDAFALTAQGIAVWSEGELRIF
jgi:hypothetical protein